MLMSPRNTFHTWKFVETRLEAHGKAISRSPSGFSRPSDRANHSYCGTQGWNRRSCKPGALAEERGRAVTDSHRERDGGDHWSQHADANRRHDDVQPALPRTAICHNEVTDARVAAAATAGAAGRPVVVLRTSRYRRASKRRSTLRTTHARPAAPRQRRRSGSSHNWTIAAARAEAFSGSAKSPAPASSQTSVRATPSIPTITGRAHAM